MLNISLVYIEDHVQVYVVNDNGFLVGQSFDSLDRVTKFVSDVIFEEDRYE